MGNPDHLSFAVVIPFRDRGRDPYRQENLDAVIRWWHNIDAEVQSVSDGRTSDAQFNRHAAYNRARALFPDADVIVYTESDMLLDYDQIIHGVKLAAETPGLVVPFTEYRYLSEADSRTVRQDLSQAEAVTPESVMSNGAAIGAVNIVSRETLDLIGRWDEMFEGNWYDDTAMKLAFDVAAGPTRWVDGPAWHLYHLPGWTGDHLTDEDKAATARNEQRLKLYVEATTVEQVRALTSGQGQIPDA